MQASFRSTGVVGGRPDVSAMRPHGLLAGARRPCSNAYLRLRASRQVAAANLQEKFDAQVCVVLGTQWGDEGKGKLVDILAQQYDIVARAQVPMISGP